MNKLAFIKFKVMLIRKNKKNFINYYQEYAMKI